MPTIESPFLMSYAERFFLAEDLGIALEGNPFLSEMSLNVRIRHRDTGVISPNVRMNPRLRGKMKALSRKLLENNRNKEYLAPIVARDQLIDPR